MADAATLCAPQAAVSPADLAERLRRGDLAPYLGPGLAPAAGDIPLSPAALADFLGSKVTLPARARGNAWAAAQYIESYKLRATVTALMAEAFAQPVEPHPLHHALARLGLPLIVDCWYASTMRIALGASGNWAEAQGSNRVAIGEARWYRFFDADGVEIEAEQAARAGTLLYSPHGGILPERSFLISDADYVEVLTEIDIQTPIPEAVRERRTMRGFLFIGCRFDDQLLRTYARQITKRSAGEHFAILDQENLTRNELRFLQEQNIAVIDMPAESAIGALVASL